MQALLPYFGPQFGNASSTYALGQNAKKAVEMARTQVASMLGASDSNEIVFLSGGTESINYAIKGSALAANGFQVTYLPVNNFGCVRVQDVLDALTVQTCLVSIMLANNKVGSLQPVAAISRAVRQFVEDEENPLPVVVHTDASQAIGKVRVNVVELDVDLVTMAGHKFYAPKAVGALYVRKSMILDTIIHGASQENGRCVGTENVGLVAALGQACALVEKNLHEYGHHAREQGVPPRADPEALQSHELIEADGVYASAGSACHSHKQDRTTEQEKNLDRDGKHITTISHVLAAMHVAPEFAKGTLRLSVGRSTTQEEVLHAANAIHKAIQQLL
ncbi:hypothetical protein KXD40_002793 [Peronospora effusa]|nr:hypothetical protein KXD40_002793 [Peronospora effusa]